jgi:hypothetical protein
MLIVILMSLCSYAQTHREGLWETNGRVAAMAATSSTLYLGGYFDYVGPHTGNLVAVDTAEGNRLSSFPYVTGTIEVCISDGEGGWFVGGKFQNIGDVARVNAAHILADGSVDPDWNPSPNAQVNDMVLSGKTLYICGRFTNIDGQPWSCAVALNAQTGHVIPTWFSALSSNISEAYTMAVYNDLLFLGDNYYGLIQIDTLTGAQNISWEGSISGGSVKAMAISGQTLYVGGDFTTANSQTRNYLASFNVNSGELSAWNPNPSLNVYTLGVYKSTLYVGGIFKKIGSTMRYGLAAFNISDGSLMNWNGNIGGVYYPSINKLAVAGSKVYITGAFLTANGQDRCRLAALDAESGTLLDWDPKSAYPANAIGISGSTALLCGELQSVGGQLRKYLASIDRATGAATDWNPKADKRVISMALSGSTLYVGGDFTSIAGVWRDSLASFDTTTGALNNWTPYTPDGAVWSLAVAGDTVYVGGWFTHIGSTSRKYIASLNATTGALTSWNPGASSRVAAMTVAGPTLYVGGQFTTLGGASRSLIGSFDIGTGALNPWNPTSAGGVNPQVESIAVSGSTVYVVGDFAQMGGKIRSSLVALDAVTGEATDWNPLVVDSSVTPWIQSIAVYGPVVCIGGFFTNAGGQPRYYLAAIDAITGNATPWNPGANSYVDSIIISDSSLFIGGNFSSVGGIAGMGVAEFDMGYITQPIGADIYTGDSKIFAIDGAFGFNTPSFQWKWMDKSSVVHDGPTTSSWSISNTPLDDAGEYWCEVTCDGRVFESEHANLGVEDHLQISIASSLVDVKPGDSCTFLVNSSGGYKPISYQWKLNGGPIPGATGSEHVIASLDLADVGVYSVEVADSNTDVKVDSVELSFSSGVPVSSSSAVILLAGVLALAGFIAIRGKEIKTIRRRL